MTYGMINTCSLISEGVTKMRGVGGGGGLNKCGIFI